MANSEIRVGRISSINYETGMARVTYRDKDESVTSEFPMLTYNDEYRMPEIGQDVLVAHLSNGSGRGAILGTIWNQKYSPAETGNVLYRKDLSRKKDAAYIRYSDETGEYLIKVANLHLNGVNKTILDGPRVEIAANLSMLIQSTEMQMDMEQLLITGGEAGAVEAAVKTDVKISQEENQLEATILKVVLKLMENLDMEAETGIAIKAGEGAEMTAGTKLKLAGQESAELASGGSLRLSDDTYSVTLTEIMERLEALEGS